MLNKSEKLREMESEFKRDCGFAFNRWMSDPTTKVLLSIAPPFEHMESLLKAAFEHGFRTGQGAFAGEMLFEVLKGPARGKYD